MPVVLIDEHIVYWIVSAIWQRKLLSMNSLLFLLSPTPRLGGAKAYDCIGNSCAIIGRVSNSVCIYLSSRAPTMASPLVMD